MNTPFLDSVQTSFMLHDDEAAPMSPPPPYEEHCTPFSCVSPVSDPNAWPSSYYRRKQRINLAEFYQEILLQSQQSRSCQENTHEDQPCQDSPPTPGLLEHAAPLPRVSFSTEPPMIHEYEAEYDSSDDEDEPRDPDQLLAEAWPGHPRKSHPHDPALLRKVSLKCTNVTPWPALDLRPIQNMNYCPSRAPTPAVPASPEPAPAMEKLPTTSPKTCKRTATRRRPSVLLRTLTLIRSASLR